MKIFENSVLVKPDELNHHGTIFAGKGVYYLIETGFFTVASEYENPNEIVCYAINNFRFLKPVPNGSILTYKGVIVRLTSSTITVNVQAYCKNQEGKYMEGLITYITVDEKTRLKKHHNLTLDDTKDEAELKLRIQADDFFKKAY